jgi:hypothetical protein
MRGISERYGWELDSMFKRLRRLKISGEAKMIFLVAVLMLVYIILWTFYFLGFFPEADKYR